MELYWLINKD